MGRKENERSMEWIHLIEAGMFFWIQIFAYRMDSRYEYAWIVVASGEMNEYITFGS